MPIGAWAHSHYWREKTPQAPPAGGAPGIGGYPEWQSTVIIGSLFGSLQVLWERMTWSFRLWRMLMRFAPDERRDIVNRVLVLLSSPQYGEAKAAAKKVATTLGFNKPTEWGNLASILKTRQDLSENHWRHHYAYMILEESVGDKLNRAELNLLAELAYHGYALRPRG